MRRSLLIAPLLMVAAIASTALPAAARAPIAIGVANPDGRGQAAVDAHIDQVGTTPHLWALWSDWGSRGTSQTCLPDQGNCAFPTEAVLRLQGQGITPVIWWQPIKPGGEVGLYSRYQRTLNGVHDAYITDWARAARAAGEATGRPVIIRYAHEATGYWFPWSVGRYDNTKENYKAAWRYVWKIFKREGALPHVRFLWSTVFPYEWAYPGDQYISYVGVTVLNFGEDRRWRDPVSLIDKRVDASRRFTDKPIIIAELASHYLGGDKDLWLERAYNSSYYKHPKIRGIMYLDTDEPYRISGQPDWRLVKPDDGSALNAYREIASLSRFQGTLW